MNRELGLKIDAKIAYEELFLHVKNALMGGLDKVFLINPVNYNQNQLARLIELCHNYQSVLLFVDDLKYALINDCDGIYFDNEPMTIDETIPEEDFLVGVKYDQNSIELDTQNLKLDFVVISSDTEYDLSSLGKTLTIYTEVNSNDNLENVIRNTEHNYIVTFTHDMDNGLENYIKEVKSKLNH